jgi:integrase
MEAFAFRFDDFKTLVFLTEDEMRRVASHPYTSDLLQKVADLFIFQCHTGFAYRDVKTFHPDHHVRLSATGTEWVYKERVKTSETAILPWYSKKFAPARELVAKYNGTLPRLTNQVCNRILKEIAQLLGITKNLTTHVGRKTAATRWLNSGIPEETVARMLGNVSTKQLRTYAAVLEEKIARDVEALG